ncbi:AraC family transcriptional regulator [Enterovibrio norvegicus]|uniref:helix-turn-helix transcriptional regulator n=1 Tax=Enterovibrio norvegicus TaxID=188144 RepID=UPI0031FE5C69
MTSLLMKPTSAGKDTQHELGQTLKKLACVSNQWGPLLIYVQENFHKDITRVSVASRFGVSSAHVSRLFNQEGSVKYADYVTYVRLDRAKFMLKKYNFKVDEIAHRCGFKDTNYFCRVFKQKTGKTPSEYRLGAV